MENTNRLKIPDTYIVRYYFNFYTGQRVKIPDCPVKYQTPGNNIEGLFKRECTCKLRDVHFSELERYIEPATVALIHKLTDKRVAKKIPLCYSVTSASFK